MMGRVTVNITPLALYLLALALYGFLMALSCIRHHQHSTHHTHTDGPTARVKRSGSGWLREVGDFYRRVRSTETTCHKLVSFGGTACKRTEDNNKYVCLDADVAPTPKNCTVYSFGIGDDATFDDQMTYYGCEVYMFDPSINQDKVISTNIGHQHFYHLGLDISVYNTTFNIKEDDGRNDTVVGDFTTYAKIRSLLHHQHTPVQYMKLDIEGAEWRVLPDLAAGGHLADVKQIAIEVHTMAIITAPQHKILDLLLFYWTRLELLSRLGFRRAVFQPTVVQESMYRLQVKDHHNYTFIPTCFELLYLKRGPVY